MNKQFPINMDFGHHIKFAEKSVDLSCKYSLPDTVAADACPNMPYINPTPDYIPIAAVTPYHGWRNPTNKLFSVIRECGFNTVLDSPIISDGVTFEQKIQELLQVCKTTDRKLILHLQEFSPSTVSNQTKDLCRQIVEEYKTETPITIWGFCDSPSNSDLDSLLTFYDIIRTSDSTRMIFTNLPSICSVDALSGCEEFEDNPNVPYLAYLDKFQRLFNPPVWSFNLQPLSRNNGLLSVNLNKFYVNLEIMAIKARYTHRPFWSFCNTWIKSSGTPQNTKATLETFRFEAFSALAFGAQGILYSKYAAPTIDSKYYNSALIDGANVITPAWSAAQRVNKEIKAFSSVFLGCQYVISAHTGTEYVHKCGNVSKFWCINNIASNNSNGVLLSYIANEYSHYLIIVNHSPSIDQSLSINFNRYWEYDNLTYDSQSETLKSSHFIISDDRSRNYELPAGGYLVFRFKKVYYP